MHIKYYGVSFQCCAEQPVLQCIWVEFLKRKKKVPETYMVMEGDYHKSEVQCCGRQPPHVWKGSLPIAVMIIHVWEIRELQVVSNNESSSEVKVRSVMPQAKLKCLLLLKNPLSCTDLSHSHTRSSHKCLKRDSSPVFVGFFQSQSLNLGNSQMD